MFLCIRCVVCVIADLGTPVERKCIIKHAALSITVRWVCRNYCFLFQKSPLPKQQNTKQNHADKLRQLQWCTYIPCRLHVLICFAWIHGNGYMYIGCIEKLLRPYWVWWGLVAFIITIMYYLTKVMRNSSVGTAEHRSW